jgi:hypothetical protein
MNLKYLGVVFAVGTVLHNSCAAYADVSPSASSSAPSSSAPASSAGAPAANSQEFPRQILRTGINLNATDISPNSLQLANNVQLSSVLERLQSLRARVDSLPVGQEKTDARVDLLEARSQALQIIGRTSLEVDFVIAEMTAEQNVYSEILSTFTNDRDKLLARVNAASFISNGVLWAVCESLSIPTHTRSVYAVPSGITGIAAGLVPSIASMYTLKAVNGKRKTSEVEPNMLAKLFNYPTSAEIEYPKSVWLYLNEAPADGTSSKTRKDQMIDRWIADSNIPGFTSRDRKTLDAITGSVAQKKGLSIATLTTRQVMLQQLSAEVQKMKRMLLELAMVVQGDKQFVASTQLRPTPISHKPSTTSRVGAALQSSAQAQHGASHQPTPQPPAIASTTQSTDIAGTLTQQAMSGLGVP